VPDRTNDRVIAGVRRAIDILVAGLGLAVFAPALAVAALALWLQDRGSPLYVSDRIGRNGVPFRLVKLRSMVVDASHAGVDTTTARDTRITPVGRMLRRSKMDELPQLWNVLLGHMSLVGPRPNVPREVVRYTPAELQLLSLRPGLTDLASIVFANLAEILADSRDPNRDYALRIRPWKSQLGWLYLRHRSLRLDLEILTLTLICLLFRKAALAGVAAILNRLDAPMEVRRTVRNLLAGMAPVAVHLSGTLEAPQE
jgi:lipopolysaccharide/colanic/teichoic acid biosynthesis glycosyltransferase